ncbi:MAG: SufD family Fe-S cluster assembly protein [Firmicutes bacterium]|jgi:Fe-S cluster assembly scaffold protein SufB|nr:SufD family Fe-S cluster assembly protein [Bacillota bacterium]
MRNLQAYLKELKERAEKALTVPAAFGPDFDPALYLKEETDAAAIDGDFSRRMKEAMLLSGFDPEERDRAGSFMQQNDAVLYEEVARAYKGQVEIMAIEKALEKYDWLWDYWWRAVPVDQDKYTAYAALYQKGGYFIRILPGAQIDQPIQSCLLQSENESSQRVHNIIIAEEGSRAEIISGCTTVPQVETGMHLGISEFYVKKGAFLSFTMIHNWAEEFHVRPRSAAIIEDDATFINNYLLLKPVRSLQSNPRAILQGKGARTRFNSIVYGQEDTVLDLGTVLELHGENTRGEAISRAAADGRSRIIMRGKLVASSNTAQALLECKGILLSPNTEMAAIPELEVQGAPRAELSHEASVGPISREAVEYLMSRGLTEEEATSLLLQGFMKVGITGLPEILEKAVDEMTETISLGTM